MRQHEPKPSTIDMPPLLLVVLERICYASVTRARMLQPCYNVWPWPLLVSLLPLVHILPLHLDRELQAIGGTYAPRAR